MSSKVTLGLALGMAILWPAGGPGMLGASTIPMPAGATSWILVGNAQCDDDGPSANIDRGHCVGAVGELIHPGDMDHSPTTTTLGHATVTPDMIRGSIQTSATSFTFMDISMTDTYTLSSQTLASGTVVPITVTFAAEGTLIPHPWPCCGAAGGGAFVIRIGSVFNPAEIVIPENTRVSSDLGPASSAQVFHNIGDNPANVSVPLELTATATLDVAIGTPFPLAFYLGATPARAEIDFANSASISFTLPEGTIISSTGGYGSPVTVRNVTWSRLKSRYD